MKFSLFIGSYSAAAIWQTLVYTEVLTKAFAMLINHPKFSRLGDYILEGDSWESSLIWMDMYLGY